MKAGAFALSLGGVLAVCLLPAGGVGAESARVEQTAAATAPAVAPSHPRGFSLTYDVYTGGFRALRLDFDVDLNGHRDGAALNADYATSVRMETSGIIGFMFGWRFDASSRGAWRSGDIVPVRYHTANVWKGNERTVTIEYEDGIAAKVRARPPYSDEDRKKVAPEMIPGAVDPTSAVTALVLTSALEGECRPTTAIYDGRRRYNANLQVLEPRDLKPSSQAPFAGQAEGCKLTFERIAGFRPDRKRMQDLEVDVWMADVGAAPGATPGRVPVRLELFTPWGNGFAHLVRARDGDGTLVFGEAGGD